MPPPPHPQHPLDAPPSPPAPPAALGDLALSLLPGFNPAPSWGSPRRDALTPLSNPFGVPRTGVPLLTRLPPPRAGE